MKIYRIELPENTFLVIAKTSYDAWRMIDEDFREDLGEDDYEIYERDLSEGEVMNYDCEDLYYEGFRKE